MIEIEAVQHHNSPGHRLTKKNNERQLVFWYDKNGIACRPVCMKARGAIHGAEWSVEEVNGAVQTEPHSSRS
jgi:hypothetical protein